MSLRKFVPFVASLAMMVGAVADENYSNINLGPTFFTFKGVEEQDGTTTEQQGLYCGVRAEVEYSGSDDLYMGFVGVIAPGAQTAYHTFAAKDQASAASAGMKASTSLWQTEGRIGKHYTIDSTSSVVPFVGVGYYHVGSSVTMKSMASKKEMVSEKNMEWAYFVTGASSSYSVNDMVDVGLGFKLLRHFYSNEEDVFNGEATDTKLHARWGYEVMMPVKITLGKASQWNVQAEPFMLKIDTTRAVKVVGARVSVQRAF